MGEPQSPFTTVRTGIGRCTLKCTFKRPPSGCLKPQAQRLAPAERDADLADMGMAPRRIPYGRTLTESGDSGT